MKTSDLKLKLSECLSWMRKTMSENSSTLGEVVTDQVEQRLMPEPELAAEVIDAIVNLGGFERRAIDGEGGMDHVYVRLSTSFGKITPNVLLRQMGMIKGLNLLESTEYTAHELIQEERVELVNQMAIEEDMKLMMPSNSLQVVSGPLEFLKTRERIVCPTDQDVEANHLMFLVVVNGETKPAYGIETARSVAYTLMKQQNVSCATLYRQERTIASTDQF